MDESEHFLSRWSRRKVQVRQGIAPAAGPVPAPPLVPAPVSTPQPATPVPMGVPDDGETVSADTAPPPTLDDVALLDRASDYTRFVASDVSAEVKNAALKKLFTDPHFNVMDGLDIYIEDYGRPDPLPLSMLRQMASAHALGLFRDDPVEGSTPSAPGVPDLAATAMPCEPAVPAADAAAAEARPPGASADTPALNSPEPAHEDLDLRLQPDDAARCAGDRPGPGEDAGREH